MNFIKVHDLKTDQDVLLNLDYLILARESPEKDAVMLKVACSIHDPWLRDNQKNMVLKVEGSLKDFKEKIFS